MLRLTLLVAAAVLSACGPRRDEPLTVFAAASMLDVLERAAADYEGETGRAVRVAAGPTSALARQILDGAPADLFVSANEEWMDRVEQAGRIVARTRVALAGNELVVVGPRDGEPFPIAELAERAGERIAVADPEHVPAGIYAVQALKSLGLYDALSPRFAAAADVRGALRFVARGETNLGIVYATDALSDESVAVLARFPPGAHDPIEIPAAVVTGGRTEAAAAFLAWLVNGERARRTFREAGFRPPGGAR